MKKVFIAADPLNAHLLRELLDSNGIAAVVQDERIFNVRGEVPVVYPSVWVQDEKEEAALSLVRQFEQRATPSPAETWVCPRCGEAVDGRFTECWRCDVERGSVEEKAGAQPVARTRRPNPLTVVALLGITGAVLFVLTHAPSRESRAASHNSQGLVHYNKSRFDDAIREYTRALELRTDDHDLLWNRACARWGKGDYDGFIADTSRILQERGDANLYLWRALAFERSQRYPAMREDATMALQRKPGFVDAYLCRGRARWFLGDVEGAAKDLDSAVAADPKCAEGWGTRGGLHEATGNLDSALADLQRALECNRQMGYAACG